MTLKLQNQIFANNSNRALLAQEILDGVYFEKLIAHSKAIENDEFDPKLELDTYVGTKTLIDYESTKPLGQLVTGDKIIIHGFAVSFRGSYMFEHPVEFIIPENFVIGEHVPNRLADNDQQKKIDNLRNAINKLRSYGEKLAEDNQPINSQRPTEYVFDKEVDLKVHKGVEAFLLANQLDKKLNHFLLENPKPSPEAYVNFVRDMKVTLHQKEQLFARHRDEASLIFRDILLALTVIAPIIWIGKAVHSFFTNENYSLLKNKTETQKDVDYIEDRLMKL